MKTHRLWIALFILLQGTAFSQTVLDNCADQFIDSDVANAPTIFNSPSNQHSALISTFATVMTA